MPVALQPQPDHCIHHSWALHTATHHNASTLRDTASNAWALHPQRPGLIFHSDRGGQYWGNEFRQLLQSHDVVQSMSRPGNCWDNAVAESFFQLLKRERIRRQVYATRNDARADVFNYIEMFYNPIRRHSFAGDLSPVEFERRYAQSGN